MSQKLVAGVYTAVLTPRHTDESVDVDALRALIEFQMAQGIRAFALNGATGEFCLTTPPQLRILLSAVRDVTGSDADILCGIGAAGTSLAIEYAGIAQEAGVRALLLPMPYFFPYQQEDLDGFSRAVAASTTLPILLYNLPQFTSGLAKETVRGLVQQVPNIVGIKDSSGSLDILRDLTEHGIDACRMIGNDGALASGLVEQVCDGVVSGVACVLPEVIQALCAEAGDLHAPAFAQAAQMLEEFIERLNAFPTPWGLKWIAEARGILRPSFAQPVSSHRLSQSKAMAEWFSKWHAESAPVLNAG